MSSHDCSIELKTAKLRATPARIAIMKLFESHNKPLSSDHFIEEHKDLDIDRVTVFRILNALYSGGLVRRLEFLDGKTYYELATEDHHHLICLNCTSIEDVSDSIIPEFEKEILKTKGFLVRNHSLEFYGLCRNCQN